MNITLKKIINLINENPIIAISLIYLTIRLPNLTTLPIFNDEAIYLDWGYRMVNGVSGFFYSLYDGKPPLVFWVYGVFMELFKDPLFAGRFASLITGLLTTIIIYSIGKTLFNKNTGLLASLLYILTPIWFFYDRLALQESFLTLSGIFLLFFTIKYTKTYKLKFLIVIAIIIGISFYIKINSLLFIFPLIISFILASHQRKAYQQTYFGLLLILIISTIIIFPIFIVDNSDKIFSGLSRYTSDTNKSILSIINSNFKTLIDFGFLHLLPTTTIPLLITFYLYYKNRQKDILILIVWFIIPLFILLFVSQFSVTRYLAPFIVPVIILASYALISTKNIILIPTVLIINFIIIVYFSFKPYSFINNTSKLSLNSSNQSFISGWTSGYGVQQALDYLEEISIQKPIIVGVRVDAGNPESALFAYYSNNRNQNIVPVYLDANYIDINDSSLQGAYNIYFVSRDNNLAGLEKHLTLKEKFFDPSKTSFVGVYKFEEL